MSASFLVLIIIFIEIFLLESSYIPATPPQFNVLKNSSGVNFTTLQLVFSSDGSNLTVFVGSSSISNAMAILHLNGSLKCSPPPSFNLSGYQLVSNYSYLYGPITQYDDTVGGGWQYQFWNENCSIVTSFATQESINSGEMNLFQYPLPNAQIGGFIAILQNLTTIVEYNITNQAESQTYSMPVDIQTSSYTFSPYFIYSQNREYLLATLNLQGQTLTTSSILAVFSCSNGSMIAHYDYPIIPLTIVDSGNFLGFLFQNTSLSTLQSDLYVYSIFWSTAPVLVGQFSNFAKNPQTNESNITDYAFCTNQNLFIIVTSNDSTNMHNMSVYSTNPPNSKYNQLIQNITFNYSQAGQSLSLACQSNNLALFNSEGQVFIYQYISIPVIVPPTPFLWWPIVVGVVGGLLIIAIVTFILLRYRKLRHSLVHLQHQLLSSKISQSNKNSYSDRIRVDGEQIQSQNRSMRRQQSQQSKDKQKQLEMQINNIYKQKYEKKLIEINKNCDDELRAKLKLSIWQKTSIKTQKKQLEKRQRSLQMERQSISSIQKGYIMDGSIIQVHQQDDQRSVRSVSQVYPIQSALRTNIRDQNLQQRQRRGQSDIINQLSDMKKLNDFKFYKKSSRININKNKSTKIDTSNQMRQYNLQVGQIAQQQTVDINNVIILQNDAHIYSKSYKAKLRQKFQEVGNYKTQNEKNNETNYNKQFEDSMLKQSVKNFKADRDKTLDNNARLNVKTKNQFSVPINDTINNIIVARKNSQYINQRRNQDQENTKDNVKQRFIQNQIESNKNQLKSNQTEFNKQ